MQIYIMRHGEAANIAGEDSLRPLTIHGKIEAEKMGLWLVSCKPRLLNILVSPYLRAQQSCVTVIDVLSKASLLNGISPETVDFITPSGNARQVHDYIDGLVHNNNDDIAANNSTEEQAILLVSHMPFVSYLVGELTGSLNMPIFSTGAIAIIDYDIKQMQGKLLDIVSPARVKL
ncbi:MAG: phosphohistidine phosphatase SixA [Colwellia sp.]|nr:phosphohistidine phosphatase SixA [Colwellia sp.]